MFKQMSFKKSYIFNICCKNSDLEEFYHKLEIIQHKGDGGIDIFFPNDVVIPANSRILVPLGICCQLTSKSIFSDNFCSYYLFPRSSICKTPLLLCNSIGLIDSGYTGELKAPFYNTSSTDYLIKKGTSLLQVVNPTLKESKLKIVRMLKDPQSTRGEGGFGSTH
jgi:dUTP pyrophosphatase